MVEVPFVEVSHLAPSSSFFSAILQPLGLTYFKAADGDSVTFGANGDAVLQVRQSFKSHRLSSLVLSAPSRSAVVHFHDCGLRANPRLLPQQAALLQDGGDDGVVRATVLDLDGNRMEVVYPDPDAEARHHDDDAVRYSGPPVRKTQSTSNEVGRILEWNYDVASVTAAGADADADAIPGAQVPPSVSTRPRQSSRAISTSTVVGALLGLAAGAALTYGMVSRNREAFPADNACRAPPRRPRRAAFSELPDKDGFAATLDHDQDRQRRHHAPDWAPQRCLASSSTSVAKPVARSRHPSRARSRSEAPPEHVTDLLDDGRAPNKSCYSTGSRAARGRHGAGRSAYVSAPTHASSTAPGRPASRAPRPLPVPEHGLAHRSRTGSSRVPDAKIAAPGSKAQSCLSTRQMPLPASRAPSYVSARRMPLPASQAPSYVSSSPARHRYRQNQAPSHVSASQVPLPVSQAPTNRGASARDMPLPASGVGSSHANWDNDLDSVLPGDSISCVDGRTSDSRRGRRHHYY